MACAPPHPLGGVVFKRATHQPGNAAATRGRSVQRRRDEGVQPEARPASVSRNRLGNMISIT
jgi:hypothetical protein